MPSDPIAQMSKLRLGEPEDLSGSYRDRSWQTETPVPTSYLLFELADEPQCIYISVMLGPPSRQGNRPGGGSAARTPLRGGPPPVQTWGATWGLFRLGPWALG